RVATHEGGSPQGPSRRPSSRHPRKRRSARIRDPRRAEGQQRRTVRPAVRHHLPGVVPVGAGWPHRRSVDAGRRAPSTSNLRAHRGRPPGARPASGVVAGVRDRGVGRSPAGGAMPGDRMTRTAELDPAAVRVVEDYLAELAERMPAHAPLTPDMVAELRDHLVDTTVALIPDSPSPVAAARGAVADFGDVETVAGAMQPELAERKARRIGIALFATGPLG